MLKKSLLSVLLVFMVLVFASGCSGLQANDTELEVEGNAIQIEGEDSAVAYPLTINDGTGREVTIPAEPKRIISLMPSLTETLFTVGAGEQVIAVSAFDNYPENVQDEAEYVFQDALNPSLEQIVNLKPDLIVMGAYNDELSNKIRSLGIPVVKYDPQNIKEVYEMIDTLGKVTNNTDNANQTVNEMKNKELMIIDKVSGLSDKERVRVWVELSNDLWTAGQNTFMNELVTKAGGINIVEKQGWIQYSEEKIVDSNPQVIITTYGNYDENAINNIYHREGWQQIDAVINKRAINVDNDIVTRTGPRIIDGLEEIAKALYPNLF